MKQPQNDRRVALENAFMHDLFQAKKALHAKACSAVTKSGLSSTQYGVLLALSEKGTACINSLIEALNTTSGNMTLVIRNMERDGLIQRQVQENDKRFSLIALTPKGKAAIDRLIPKVDADRSEALGSLSDSDLKTAIEILGKLLSDISH